MQRIEEDRSVIKCGEGEGPSQRNARIMIWNVSGLNSPSKKRLLKHNLKTFDSDIILLQETKPNKEGGIKINKMLGFGDSNFQESEGAAGRLGLIWNPRKVVNHCLISRPNWMSVSIQSLMSNLQLILIIIYSPTNIVGKRVVWDKISSYLSQIRDIGGDFNNILNVEEKVGGIQHLSQASLYFKVWTDKHNMIDIPTVHGIFTWNNRRKDFTYISQKLDRFFMIGNIDEYNLNFQSTILPITRSDHFPIFFDSVSLQNHLETHLNVRRCGFMILTSLETLKNGGR